MLPQSEPDLNDSAVMLYIASEMKKARAKAQLLRDDPATRKTMCALIADLQPLIAEHAEQLAIEKDTDDLFEIDDLADRLMWLLAEFLSASHIDREHEFVPAAHQLTLEHAGQHFGVRIHPQTGMVSFVED